LIGRLPRDPAVSLMERLRLGVDGSVACALVGRAISRRQSP